MAAIALGSMTPSALAEALLAQRQILQDHYDTLRALRSRVAEYEQRYGIASMDAHQAIDDGRLEETHDVCKWLIDIDRLERVENATR